MQSNQASKLTLNLCAAFVIVGVLLGLTGCSSGPSLSSITSIFDSEEEKLPGERISVMQDEASDALSAVAAAQPVQLPAQRENPEWSQPGGVATNAPGHLILSGGIRERWRASIGTGSSSSGRLTAIPVIAGGRIYTMDTRGTVRAFATGSGSQVWERSLVPETEDRNAGFGGGLAIEGGKLVVATGFGTVVALNPASGAVLWEKRIGLPFRMAPTVANGRVFVVNAESELFALSLDDGAQLWSARGLPESASFVSNASAAVSGDVVVVPYPSGELLAFDVASGEPKWTDSLTRVRSASTGQRVGDTARPVIDSGTVFAVSSSGRMIATDIRSGSRLWARDISGSQTPWVAGDTVFIVDGSGNLAALQRKDGAVRWVSELPAARLWNGPVLASGRLWLISNTGLLVSADASTGKLQSNTNLDTGVFITPVVASGKMYVLTDRARLLAMN
jgi:outer membrane protein assembly factor BamB